MKKLFYFLLTLTLCLSLFSVLAFAVEPDPTADTDGAQAVTDASADLTAPEAEDENASFLDALYGAYEENKSEIFSFASTVVSLILVFVYQRGLLPTVKGGLSLIEGQVKALREISSDTKAENSKAKDETQALAREMVESTQRMQEVLNAVAARAADEESREKTMKHLEECMLWQAELLGEVFLHSSLPEYEKERVTAVLERVKRMLAQQESEA